MANTQLYTLSLHDALPILQAINVTAPEFFRALDSLLARSRIDDVRVYLKWRAIEAAADTLGQRFVEERFRYTRAHTDRKSTRLNSSHANISYAVFCLKKKK